ncbi:USP2 [Cordylochernes scorpioides]|uniref:ubiquitinyl hydrolase 1 n=1 Tax=Cordylochernes scorpioides TaxID=51811 RepID=A0ABY6KZM8_9ARAC|nr:USP2 [Cordylochernes scorpioides]
MELLEYVLQQLHAELNQAKKSTEMVEIVDQGLRAWQEYKNFENSPICQEKRSHQTFGISKWPDIMVIHLKRFSFIEIKKIDKMVLFPFTLDLSKFGATTTYNLYAVVNHFGNMNFGHYIAACKHPKTAEWYKFDDHVVRKITTKDVVTKNAYILLYQNMQ